MFIRWRNSCSNKFYVTNGDKQGGILSPALFNVYMNNLSVTLNQSGIGGFLGDSLVNHICYADDLCLIALSSSGMQHLLDLCNYLTMQQNHFLYVLNQIELKLNHQTLHWEKKLFHL